MKFDNEKYRKYNMFISWVYSNETKLVKPNSITQKTQKKLEKNVLLRKQNKKVIYSFIFLFIKKKNDWHELYITSAADGTTGPGLTDARFLKETNKNIFIFMIRFHTLTIILCKINKIFFMNSKFSFMHSLFLIYIQSHFTDLSSHNMACTAFHRCIRITEEKKREWPHFNFVIKFIKKFMNMLFSQK